MQIWIIEILINFFTNLILIHVFIVIFSAHLKFIQNYKNKFLIHWIIKYHMDRWTNVICPCQTLGFCPNFLVFINYQL